MRAGLAAAPRAIARLSSASLLLLGACEREPLPDFDTLWDFDNPALSEERFRDVLDRDPDDRDYRIQLTTQLARAVGLQGRFDEAVALLEAVQAELPKCSPATQMRWWLERGRIFASSGSPVLARKPFQDALAIASRVEATPMPTKASDGMPRQNAASLDRYAIDALHMMAIISEGKDRITWNQKAISLAKKTADPAAQGWLGSLYNNLGFAELDLGRYAAALKTHRAAEAWYAAKGDARLERISKWAVGKTLRMLDRCKEALVIQQDLEAAWDAQGTPDGFVYEEIAECRLVQGDPDVARLYFSKAYELLQRDAWIVEHEPDRLERIEVLSQQSGAEKGTG